MKLHLNLVPESVTSLKIIFDKTWFEPNWEPAPEQPRKYDTLHLVVMLVNQAEWALKRVRPSKTYILECDQHISCPSAKAMGIPLVDEIETVAYKIFHMSEPFITRFR